MGIELKKQFYEEFFWYFFCVQVWKEEVLGRVDKFGVKVGIDELDI